MIKLEYITKKGLLKLRKKINFLETVERRKISKQISEARDKGDLAENSEYHAAKEAQNLLEIKILHMKKKLFNYKIIDKSNLNNDKVSILSTVFLKNLTHGYTCNYMLVPDSESDIKSGKISINTPISKGLLGKVKGDIVNIKLPNNLCVKFKILDIKIL